MCAMWTCMYVCTMPHAYVPPLYIHTSRDTHACLLVFSCEFTEERKWKKKCMKECVLLEIMRNASHRCKSKSKNDFSGGTGREEENELWESTKV